MGVEAGEPAGSDERVVPQPSSGSSPLAPAAVSQPRRLKWTGAMVEMIGHASGADNHERNL